MTIETHTYKTCAKCGQYINIVNTDHVRAKDVNGEVYMHIVPCRRFYEGALIEEQIIRKHQHNA
jgi:hypothetical protein